MFQATIGIDFLSKTMYLEDRTVSFVIFFWFVLLCSHSDVILLRILHH